MGLTQNSKESPLVQGQYEKQLLTKLENLHKQGYTPKLKKPKPLRNKSEWRDTVPQPPGRHISQRDTVGINMAHPPLERSNMMDTK
jgi:hypothetical protein